LSTDLQIPLTLHVFGKKIQLNLRRNDHVALTASKLWKYNVKSIKEKLLFELKASDSCIYFHENNASSAVISMCQENVLVISYKNDLFKKMLCFYF